MSSLLVYGDGEGEGESKVQKPYLVIIRCNELGTSKKKTLRSTLSVPLLPHAEEETKQQRPTAARCSWLWLQLWPNDVVVRLS